MVCRKLTDTPIPFPWVQAINAALLIFTILAPIAIVAFIKSLVLSGILTFMVVSTYVTLNEVALDIEDPFHYDPNELPLPQVPTPRKGRFFGHATMQALLCSPPLPPLALTMSI